MKALVLAPLAKNIAYAVRANLEQVERITGREAVRICAGGGMSSNEVFVQMLADVLSRAVFRTPMPHVSGLGAAMAAATASGAYGSLSEASEAMSGVSQCVEPDPSTSVEYLDLYKQWREMGVRLVDVPL